MPLYSLYLESGPKHKKTMAHVLDLLGCVVTGPTTEETLARAPAGIREYLRFLRRHGDAVDPDAAIQTEVREHITEGQWLGNGSASALFGPDVGPLPRDELERLIARLQWQREDLLALVGGRSEAEMVAKPATARAVREILAHVFGAEYSYIRAFGKLADVAGPGPVERMATPALIEWMTFVREREIALLRGLSDAERAEFLPNRAQPRTARRILRRALEHEWEHLGELRDRLTPES